MGDRERLLLADRSCSCMTAENISAWEMWQSAPIRIIMATEIIGLSTEERQIIANAVRYNTAEFVYYSEIAGEVGMDQFRSIF